MCGKKFSAELYMNVYIMCSSKEIHCYHSYFALSEGNDLCSTENPSIEQTAHEFCLWHRSNLYQEWAAMTIVSLLLSHSWTVKPHLCTPKTCSQPPRRLHWGPLFSVSLHTFWREKPETPQGPQLEWQSWWNV